MIKGEMLLNNLMVNIIAAIIATKSAPAVTAIVVLILVVSAFRVFDYKIASKNLRNEHDSQTH